MELIWVKKTWKNHMERYFCRSPIRMTAIFAIRVIPFSIAIFMPSGSTSQGIGSKRPVMFFFKSQIKVVWPIFWLTNITGGFILRTFSMILIYFHRIFKKCLSLFVKFPRAGRWFEFSEDGQWLHWYWIHWVDPVELSICFSRYWYPGFYPGFLWDTDIYIITSSRGVIV